jgi:hypothetical protein
MVMSLLHLRMAEEHLLPAVILCHHNFRNKDYCRSYTRRNSAEKHRRLEGITCEVQCSPF